MDNLMCLCKRCSQCMLLLGRAQASPAQPRSLAAHGTCMLEEKYEYVCVHAWICVHSPSLSNWVSQATSVYHLVATLLGSAHVLLYMQFVTVLCIFVVHVDLCLYKLQ